MREFTAKQYIDLWIAAEEGSATYPPHSVYQYVSSQYLQLGKSNAALYCANRVLEELHGSKLDLDNVVWDVPSFLERRKAVHKWDIIIPDEMQRNAGNRTWQTEDNAIVGEELETGSFQHKHVIMTVPAKHRLDKLIADVCTSQMVVDRTDAHNQISWVSIYTLARGQLDRNARERTPSVGSMTVGRYPEWSEYLKRKTDYYDKRRERNIEKAKTIQTEATEVHASISPDEIESLLINQNPDCRQRGEGSDFSVSRVRIWLKDKGYGEVPYWRVQMGTASANEHARLKKRMEDAEKT